MQRRAVNSALRTFEVREFVAKRLQMALDLAHGDGDHHRAATAPRADRRTIRDE